MSSNIKIPEKLESILNQSQELDGIVKQTASDFSPIFRDNKLYFFEEYTDHGIDHIERVLLAAEEVISEDTFTAKILSPVDVAVLILSVILHDLGMQINYETFKVLIETKEYDDVLVKEIDSQTWSQLWESYLNEVKKFSGKQRKTIFGDENWEFKVPDLSHKDNLTGFDKKLIGEFIRRHHPRLAQEVALKGGIIGNEGNILKFATNLNPLITKLVGLVARSHGMEIRDTFRYLNEIVDIAWKKPANINVIFLMVVLRISDYFQIDSSRTAPSILKLKSFSSPLSEFEHNKHLGIESTSEWIDDPETLLVLARPTTSLMNLKLKELFNNIQYELDISWAVLGEIYGKEIFGKQPKIKYRRINSNLNSDSKFYNSINYVPEKMAFEADQDLIKLLISPLYGNNPSYGVRELLQNSIDACKERSFLEGDESEYLPRIKLSINTNEKSSYFEISDNGKGMSLFEIKNYFLKAGASFRKSLAWKKSYTDDDGKALVERTGRFGVGALAAFLMGEEINVLTRNTSDAVGYTFKASLDTEQIEVTKVSDASVGTTITIQMNDEKVKFLLSNPYKWTDWYRLKSPQIIYEVIRNKEATIINQSFDDPTKDEQLDTNWHKIEIANFGLLHWTYPEGSNGRNYGTSNRPNYITCNGFFIPKDYDIGRVRGEDHTVHICPKISIFDNEGKLPLTLNRGSIDGKLPFEGELLKDICKDFIAKLLMTQPKSKVVDNIVFVSRERFKHSCSGLTYSFYINKNGFNINCHSVRRKIAKKFKYIKFNIFELNKIEKIKFDQSFNMDDYMFFFEKGSFKSISSYKEIIDPYYYYGTTGGRITVRNIFYDIAFTGNNSRLRSRFLSDHKLFVSNGVWTTIDYNFKADSSFNIEKISPHDCIHSIIQFPGTTLPYFRTDMGGTGLDILNKLFDKYFGNSILIPYDMEQRKNLFNDAFNDLEPYMRKYEKLVQQ